MNTALTSNGIQSTHIASYYQLLLSTTLPIYKHLQRKGMKKKPVQFIVQKEKNVQDIYEVFQHQKILTTV